MRLTLDSQIQYYAEDVLEKTLRDTGGKSAVSIVMDPRTGEVLAMANVTREGFHGFGKGDQAAERNRAVTDVYEPGSIFKLVTISGALADGTVTPDYHVHACRGACGWPTARSTTRIHMPPRPTTCVEILQDSSNVGAVKIGQKMGEAGMYRWIKAFGFGKPTGVELPRRGAAASSTRSKSGPARPSATSPWDRASP